MGNLCVTLVQTSLCWENPDANLQHIDSLLNLQKNSTDVIVLPEMFTTGFTMKPEKNAEKHGGKGLQWMRRKSEEHACCVAGSICVEDAGKFFNRLYWVDAKGEFVFYDKRHLFRMGNEEQHYAAGNKKTIVECKGWKILPLVCYDLRFPVWSRNRWHSEKNELNADYDCLIYVANWPEVRNYPWKQLLIARAIENQSYVVGVNRIGADGNIIMHSGDSVAVNPLGETISKLKAHQEGIETIELDMEFLRSLRKKFPVGMDTDDFDLKI